MAKKLMKLLLVVPLVAVFTVAAFADGDTSEDATANVDVIVQPEVDLILHAPINEYNFGSLPVETSSNAADSVTLQNQSEVHIRLEREVAGVSADGEEWSLTDGSPGHDQFGLWMEVAGERVDGYEEFHSNSRITGAANERLTDSAGDDVVLTIDQIVQAWFRIDMPATVSDTTEQTIDVMVTAISE